MKDRDILNEKPKGQKMTRKPASKTENSGSGDSLILSPHSGQISPKFDAGNMLGRVFDQAEADLRAWAQLYLGLQVKGVKSQETFRQTSNDLTDFLRFFDSYFHCFDLFKWTPQATKRYIEDLQELGRKPATISRRLISIRAFGGWILSHRPDLYPLGDPTNHIKLINVNLK
ncbi:hypothetical protein JW979_02905 [bacterium]|nr:hypothetical protein [candidate division CSSED10-310 bacterium]